MKKKKNQILINTKRQRRRVKSMFCDALPPPSLPYLSPNSFSRFASLCFISFYSSGFSSFSFRVPHLFIIISKVLLNPSFAEMICFFGSISGFFFFGQFFSFYFVSFPKEGGNAIIITTTTTKLISKTLLLIFVSLSLSYDNFYLFFFFQFVHNPTTTNTCINDISYIQDLREREISKSKLFFFFFLTLI